MYFSVGDGAGIGVARSVTRRPEGPFEDVLGRPLVPGVVRGAEGIDAQVFVDYKDPNEDDGGVHGGDGAGAGDREGRNWLYFGGWGHAVVVELGSDMVSLKGEYKEITPEGYVEGPWMMKRDRVYYFMFSVGGYVPFFPFPYTLAFPVPYPSSTNTMLIKYIQLGRQLLRRKLRQSLLPHRPLHHATDQNSARKQQSRYRHGA